MGILAGIFKVFFLCIFAGNIEGILMVNSQFFHRDFTGILQSFWCQMSRVSRLGEISPFGQFFMALGKFFSRKNCPLIWAKF